MHKIVSGNKRGDLDVLIPPESHGSPVECSKAPHGYQEFLSSESLFDDCQDPAGEQLWVVYREQRQWSQMNRTRLPEGKNKTFQLVLRKTMIAFPVSRLSCCGNLNKDGCDERSAVENVVRTRILTKMQLTISMRNILNCISNCFITPRYLISF